MVVVECGGERAAIVAGTRLGVLVEVECRAVDVVDVVLAVVGQGLVGASVQARRVVDVACLGAEADGARGDLAAACVLVVKSVHAVT